MFKNYSIIDSPDVTGGVTVVKVGIGTPNKEQYIYYIHSIML